MPAQKNKSGVIAMIAVVVIAAVGGFAAYMSGGDKAPEAEVQANAEEAQINPAEVNTAAGDAQDKTTPSPIGENGINVEPGNPVVARVDGKDITRVDVYRFIQTMPQNLQQLPATTVYPMAMDQVINTRLVQNKANDADVENSDDFKRELEIAKQQIVRNLYLQEQVNNKITDKMVKNAYNDYIKKIPDVEERRARHILVETEEKANAVIKKLDTGEGFEDLAKSLSIGPTATKGGDLGYFAKNEMVPEFAEAAFSMKKGSVSEKPVKTQFGWHVIKVIDKRERPKPSLEQMTPVLQAELRRTALEDLLKGWRKNAKIEQFDINGKPLRKGADATGLVPEEKQPVSPQQGG